MLVRLKINDLSKVEPMLAEGHTLEFQFDLSVQKIGDSYAVRFTTPFMAHSRPFNSLEDAFGWITALGNS